MQWSVLQLLAGGSPEAAARLAEAAPRIVGTAIAVGACIGWLVPTMHRSRNRVRPEPTPQPALAIPG